MALHHFAQAIASHEAAAGGNTAEGTGAVGAFAPEMQGAIELLLASWVPSTSERVRDAAADAIGSMVVLLPPSHMRTLMPKLLPSLLAEQRRKREWERFNLTAALWAALAHAEACGLGRELHSEQLLLPALSTLHGAVCSPLDRSSAACLRNHNEELRCIEALGGLAFEPVLTYLMQQLEQSSNSGPSTICGTLEVLRHLVQRLHERIDGRKTALLRVHRLTIAGGAAQSARLAIVHARRRARHARLPAERRR